MDQLINCNKFRMDHYKAAVNHQVSFKVKSTRQYEAKIANEDMFKHFILTNETDLKFCKTRIMREMNRLSC